MSLSDKRLQMTSLTKYLLTRHRLLFFLFFFYLGFKAHQDYFIHFELGQKQEIPEKKHLTTHPQVELGLPELGSNPEQ